MTRLMTEAGYASHQAKHGRGTKTELEPYVVPVKAKRLTVKRKQSDIEILFEQQIQLVKLPAATRNYKFHPGRRFELDFAWPELGNVAVEVQGMVHRIKERFEADIEKRALALLGGWTVLEVSGASIRDGRAIGWLETLFKQRGIKCSQ